MRHFGKNNLARLHAGELIIFSPICGIGFAHCRHDTRFERLKHRIAIGKEFQADFINHIGATAHGQVRAPIIRIAA